MKPASLRKLKLRNNFAFTLIEVLVVLAVIGILTTIVVGGFRQTQRRGRDAQRKSDLKQMAGAMEIYLSDYGNYPPSAVDGKIMGCPAETTVCDWDGGEFKDPTGNIYFKNLPADPLSNQSYFYRAFDSNQKYQIFARLENPKDKDCLGGNCSPDPVFLPSGVSCESSEVCNFAVYSPNVRLAETFAAPTPTPAFTPTPTPTPIFTPTPTPTFTPSPTPTPAGPSWWDTAWSYRKEITIQSSQVTANLTNFPVLISISDADLSSKAQADGDDIVFTDQNAVKLDHEIERYTSGTGNLVAWVEVPNVSSTANTVIYMYYGNASALNQENVAGVWDSNYMGVWHLAEDPSISSDGDCGGGTAEFCDSTSNNNDGDSFGTMTSGDLITTNIDGGYDLDGSDDYLDPPLAGGGLDVTGSQLTLSGWARTPTGGVDNDEALINKTGTSYPYMVGMQDTASVMDQTNCRVGTAGGDGAARINIDNVVPVNTWTYLVCRYDGSTLEVFVDGSSVGTDSTAGGNINSGTNVYLGRRGDTRRYEGDMDELRVSNITRSDGWIATEYNNQSSPGTFYTIGTEEIGLAPGGVFLAAVQQILSTIKQNTQQVLGVMTEVLTNSLGLERSQ